MRPGDWSKYEGNRSSFEEWQLELLESWGCGRNPKDIVHVMGKIIQEFKQVHKRLCEKLNFKENREWIDEILNLVQ